MCADTGARTPIGASGICLNIYIIESILHDKHRHKFTTPNICTDDTNYLGNADLIGFTCHVCNTKYVNRISNVNQER